MKITQIQNHDANQPSNCRKQSSSEASDIKWRNAPCFTKPKGWLNCLREAACEPLFLASWIHYTHLQHMLLGYVLTLFSPSFLVLPSSLLSSLPTRVTCQSMLHAGLQRNIQHLFISHTSGYSRIWCGLTLWCLTTTTVVVQHRQPSKRCILYSYSTNTGTEYFKHGIYSSMFSLQNAVCFIILTYLVPVLLIFYIQVCWN